MQELPFQQVIDQQSEVKTNIRNTVERNFIKENYLDYLGN